MAFFWRRLDAKFAALAADIRQQSARTDKLYENWQEAMALQTERTDKLYDSFVELVKETRK